MVEVTTTFDVPDEIIPELKKKYASEKDNDLRVTRANPSNPPYYAFGDPRAKPEPFKFEGKEYWVYKVSKGRKMNWVYDHE
ncbi:MAG: hypothetical protein HPY73_03740 [Methanomassiliicoccales archaeon]|nr:MAG: hypothetical protein HPY73_03740 [Methanomassiliicoccales archaeon]